MWMQQGEKEIKGWIRQKKIELIEGVNPKWKDLTAAWYMAVGRAAP